MQKFIQKTLAKKTGEVAKVEKKASVPRASRF